MNEVTRIDLGSFGDLTLYARWLANSHQISFVSNGGAYISPLKVSYGESVNLPDAVRQSYEFLYWCTDETLLNRYEDETLYFWGWYLEETYENRIKVIDENIDKDLTLYARWLVSGNSTYTLKVYFENLDGTYETIEDIYEHIDEIKGKTKEKLLLDRDNAFMSKDIATIYRDVPLDIDLSDCLISSTCNI